MTAYSLLKPELYTVVDGASVVPEQPCLLLGGRCQCGTVFFPMQSYGCENCGAVGEALQPEKLSGAGCLMASAKVHVHQAEGREAPFIVASVQLDAGPVVRTLLDWPPTEEPPAPGVRVIAILLPLEGAGNDVLDLRFRPQPKVSS